MSEFHDALYEIATILVSNNIEYMISGSMAGKFYGLERAPHDIDIYVFRESLPLIERYFAGNITTPLYHYSDDFFDENIIELEVNKIPIEICVLDDSKIHSLLTGETIPMMRFYEHVPAKFRDIEVKVQSLEALIGYKQHNTNEKFALNQMRDVEELREILNKKREQNTPQASFEQLA